MDSFFTTSAVRSPAELAPAGPSAAVAMHAGHTGSSFRHAHRFFPHPIVERPAPDRQAQRKILSSHRPPIPRPADRNRLPEPMVSSWQRRINDHSARLVVIDPSSSIVLPQRPCRYRWVAIGAAANRAQEKCVSRYRRGPYNASGERPRRANASQRSARLEGHTPACRRMNSASHAASRDPSFSSPAIVRRRSSTDRFCPSLNFPSSLVAGISNATIAWRMRL